MFAIGLHRFNSGDFVGGRHVALPIGDTQLIGKRPHEPSAVAGHDGDLEPAFL